MRALRIALISSPALRQRTGFKNLSETCVLRESLSLYMTPIRTLRTKMIVFFSRLRVQEAERCS